MKRVMRQAYTEVNEILKYLPKEYVEKVPIKLRKLFNDSRLEDYPVHIDLDKDITEQKLVYEAFVILTILKLDYWCETEEERIKIEEQIEKNKIENEEKFDIYKLMENKKTENDIESVIKSNEKKNLPLKVEKQSWLSKFFIKIKKIFNGKNEVAK